MPWMKILISPGLPQCILFPEIVFTWSYEFFLLLHTGPFVQGTKEMQFDRYPPSTRWQLCQCSWDRPLCYRCQWPLLCWKPKDTQSSTDGGTIGSRRSREIAW